MSPPAAYRTDHVLLSNGWQRGKLEFFSSQLAAAETGGDASLDARPATPPSPQIQLLEEVVALVVDDDEAGPSFRLQSTW